MKHKLKSAAACFAVLYLLSIQSIQAQDSTRKINLKEAIDAQKKFRTPMYIIARKQKYFWEVREKVFE